MNIKQLMVTFFIALLAGGEIGARVLTDKFVYSQGELEDGYDTAGVA